MSTYINPNSTPHQLNFNLIFESFLFFGPNRLFLGGLGLKTNSGSTQLVEQFLFSVFSLILSFDLDFIMRPFLTIWGPIASLGLGW